MKQISITSMELEQEKWQKYFGKKSQCVCVCMWRFFVGVYFTLYLQGPKSLLAQIWYGDFYI